MKGKRLDICRQSGEISPNLATLLTNERTNERWWKQKPKFFEGEIFDEKTSLPLASPDDQNNWQELFRAEHSHPSPPAKAIMLLWA